VLQVLEVYFPVADFRAAKIGIYEKALPYGLDWPMRLAAAAQAGYDFVEISIDESDEFLDRLNWDPTKRAELHHAVQASGVAITSMCLSAHRKYPLGSLSPSTRARSLSILEQSIQLSLDTGIRINLVPGYDVFYEPSNARTQDLFLAGLEQGVAWASSAGVMLAFENVDQYVISVSQAMYFIRFFNSPWLQLYLDVGNLAGMGQDIVNEIDVGAGHIAGVHLKDASPGRIRQVPLGQGSVPFKAVFSRLQHIGFFGPFMLELWNAGEEAQEFITAARQWIREQIEP
jgi:L-ribulose-5-phosphate 3-epimerase